MEFPWRARPGREITGRRLSVRSLVLVVALLPTAAFGVLAAGLGASRLAEHGTAAAIAGGTVHLDALLRARVDVTGEDVTTAALAAGAADGLSAAQVGALLGEDMVGAQRTARAAVDADAVLGSTPALRAARAEVWDLRQEADAGRLTTAAVVAGFQSVTGAIDHAWLAAAAGLQAQAARLPDARFTAEVATLEDAFAAYRAGLDQVGDTNSVLSAATPTPALVEQLVGDGARLQAALAGLGASVGPHTAAAVARYRHDPSVAAFAATVARTEDDAISGRASSLAADVAAYGTAFRHGVVAVDRLTAVVDGASSDLRAGALGEEAAATGAVVDAGVGLALLVALAVAMAVGLARSVSRPLERIEAGAAQIRAGDFGVDPLPVVGPRELAETAAAFNEMARVLRLVEAQTVALANEDFDAPVLGPALPGRTGAALGRALDHLRASLRAAERRRRALERDATHDALTGLLNRAAVLDGLRRALAAARRDGTMVAVAFLDVDHLKQVNDAHGHAAGDAVIRATAAALRAATREADVVGRLGGDEFLVVAVVGSVAEADGLGRRVHDAVAAQRVDGPEGPVPLSCSVGVAVAAGGDPDGRAAVHRADEALYAAKRAGRDRVVRAGAGAG